MMDTLTFPTGTPEGRREALHRFMGGRAVGTFQFFVTLVPPHRSPWRYGTSLHLERWGLPERSRGLSLAEEQRHLRMLLQDFDARLARRLCGSKWTKRPDTRPYWIFHSERKTRSGSILPHWHGIMGVMPEHLSRLRAEASAAWSEVAPGGKVDVQRITDSPADRDRVVGYQIKQQSGDALDQVEIGLGYDPSKRC
jgi:hypothetical protein